MDRYSYDPNSRIARRIKERERKKRRNRRIMGTTALLLVLAVVAFGVFKYVGLGSGILKEFNPAAGLERLVAAITDNNEDKLVSNDLDTESEDAVVPELEEPVNEPEPEEQTDENIPDVPATAEGIYPPASENNNLLDIFKNAAGETEKICALTFDDGPNKTTTPEILDILAEYDIKATFFELGEKLSQNKELAKRTYDEGHLLANHTYTQKYSTIYTSWDAFFDEVTKTDALIEEITGEAAYKLVRMPGGSFNSGVYGSVKQEYRAKLAENGYYFIDWSVDNGDNGSRTAAEILSYVKDYAGSKPIVLLMEDNSSRTATVKSLPDVIEYLKSCGYVFKRLDEICYYDDIEMPVQDISAVPDALDIFESRGYIR